ncbi:imm11 family protein [Bacillus sp. FJAT-18017]|uniref:imm11 family protein n=1 Tax=Bacillus sp. FJAT-18017 TaxID=1705566 RepID=UPI0006AFC143|nr:DUF1629 domain-containing protein [Bacillus sp. FJAT-18017]
MKIWQLNSFIEKYEVFNSTTDQVRKLFSKNFRGKPMEDIWETPQVRIYKKGKKSDFPSGLLSVPILSEKAVEVLSGLLTDKAELLPLMTTENEKYYAVNVLNVLDCIDGEQSEATRLPDNQILTYKKYAFLAEIAEGQDIFKIVDHEEKFLINSPVFVSDRFRDRVLQSGLKGFDFIEVWDSEEHQKLSMQNSLPDDSSALTYTFDEAIELVRDQNATVVSDKWAIRLDEDKEIQIGQLQDDGSYNWVTPAYFPPIFIGMKWAVMS